MGRRSAAVLAVSVVFLAGCTSAGHGALPSTSSTPTTTAPPPNTTVTSSASSASPSQPSPLGHKVLGIVLSHAKVANGYRVTLAPAKRRGDGQFVAIPGRAPVTYLIPSRLVLDRGVTLVGAIEVTANGHKVTALAIIGG